MHSGRHRDSDVDVVLELDVVLVLVDAEEPADVLDDPALVRDDAVDLAVADRIEEFAELGSVPASIHVARGGRRFHQLDRSSLGRPGRECSHTP